MKKIGVLNSDLSAVIADMGHQDWLAVGDAGTPVPKETSKIDLSVKNGLPHFIDVLDTVLIELEVQKIYLAEEIKAANPEILTEVKNRFSDRVIIEFISHEQLKQNLKRSKAFVRTGEMTPYANIILESGVVF
ncbi:MULTISPECIES: D-ribose pyranase [Lactobacillaceae]|uniref:D-ribose pyranase n=2 Tax=Leuconostoc TaxID=1243 RepID=A0A5B8T1X4_LEUPS|nr:MULTISPECIES: D-ribose pyranase [Leuconostoc]MCC8439958.1 D-ribose pyranase [Leuconostoc pseudomesenteroides]MDG9733181.1 D-ribose pyranase [Leuconostoc pseudomesenteroides]MDN2450176.1 D-ribose pyranase [Leuconostoc sp. UCMA20149]NKZ36721.1 D-ribose pyranase [Leuconostoc pseudomesenteroides]QEA41053.1 D-ribose pyranase [Leuconostoc pseudomesenteroides]